MPNWDTAHLSDEDLLLFVDGELDARRHEHARAHLTACWSCRARRDALDAAITTIVNALDEVVIPEAPAPPGPWPGLAPRLARLNQQLAAASPPRWRFVTGRMLRASGLRWAAAAVIVAAVSLAILQQRPVSAAELLARAHPVERITAHRQLTLEERSATGQLITRQRIEVWHSATTREIARRAYDDQRQLVAGEWRRADGSRLLLRRGQAPRTESSADLVPAIGDNVWRLELAASTFATLGGDVTKAVVDEHADVYLITAPGSAEAVAALRLTLSKADLHPIEQSLTFGSGSDARTFRLIENWFAEMSAAALPAGAFTPEPDLVAAVLPLEPPPPAKPLTSTSRRLGEEETLALRVDALVTLDRVGALLGEQVSVEPTADGRLRIEALVDTEARKTELATAVGELRPRWAVDAQVRTFAEAQAYVRTTRHAAPIVRSVEIAVTHAPAYDDVKQFVAERLAQESATDTDPPHSQASERLEREVRTFTAQVLQLALRARLHARAMTLAMPGRVDELDTLPRDRARSWRALVRAHAIAFQQDTEALRTALQPVFFPSAAIDPPDPSSPARPIDIQQCAARLFELASAHDASVGRAFAVSAATATEIHLKSNAFWNSLRAAERMAADIRDAVAEPQ